MFQTQIHRSMVQFALSIVILVCLCASPGCHRSYYRRQADAEAQRLIREKSNDPRWNSSDGTVDINPASRMFDPFSADHPPIPPDDAASHQFMHNVDGKPNYPHWHANGDTNWVENPQWRSYLPVNEKNQVVIDMNTAYQLALIHSPDLQQQRETLYLSALEVSIERFGFDSQLFAGFNSFANTQGRLASGGSDSSLTGSLGANGGGINWNKLGITGANFAAGLANTILWNFAGPNTQTASTLIDFSILQPLLRGAGRDRIMESLTQAERTLLANVRQMDRFRRGFYLEIITGRNSGAGPGSNFLGAPGSSNGNAGGLLGLIEDIQAIRIQEFNVRQQESLLEQFDEFYERDRLDALQVSQFKNSVYEAQQGLLQTKNAYQNRLDQFKRTLGLPPDLDVVIDDPFLDRFELLSDEITGRYRQIDQIRSAGGDALGVVNNLLPDNQREAEGFEWTPEIDGKIKELLPFLQRTKRLFEQAKEDDVKMVETDIQNMADVRADRLAYLADLREGIESGRIPSEVDPGLLADDSIPTPKELLRLLNGSGEKLPEGIDEDERPPRAVVEKLDDFKIELDKLIERVTNFAKDREEILEEAKATGAEDWEQRAAVMIYNYTDSEIVEEMSSQLTNFYNAVLELTLLQAAARSNTIEIPKVDMRSETAFKIARCFRRDWMNARAALVDEWRNIEFVADQLESQLDLVLEGSIGTFGDNPFQIRPETGQLRGGFRFDSPIIRMNERNQYRSALIQYQRSKRNFYQFEDEISRNLRQTVRQIDLNKVLFELQRRVIQVQIKQVEQSRLRLERPQSALGATTARDLTGALNGLQRAQSSFLQTWVQYEVLRRDLDFDMGTMMLDEANGWQDPGVIDWAIGERAAAMLGIQLDCQFCNEVNCPPQDATSMTPGGFYEFETPGSIPYAPSAIESDPMPSSGSPLEAFEQPAEQPVRQPFEQPGPLPWEPDNSGGRSLNVPTEIYRGSESKPKDGLMQASLASESNAISTESTSTKATTIEKEQEGLAAKADVKRASSIPSSSAAPFVSASAIPSSSTIISSSEAQPSLSSRSSELQRLNGNGPLKVPATNESIDAKSLLPAAHDALLESLVLEFTELPGSLGEQAAPKLMKTNFIEESSELEKQGSFSGPLDRLFDSSVIPQGR